MLSREQLSDPSPSRTPSHVHSLPRSPVLDIERESSASRFTQMGLMAIENQWLSNFSSACTRRAYAADVRDFAAFSGLQSKRAAIPCLALVGLSASSPNLSRPVMLNLVPQE